MAIRNAVGAADGVAMTESGVAVVRTMTMAEKDDAGVAVARSDDAGAVVDGVATMESGVAVAAARRGARTAAGVAVRREATRNSESAAVVSN